MSLPDYQIAQIIASIVGSAVGATAVIAWRLSAHHTKIEGLEGRLNTAEGDIRNMFNRIYEQSQRDAAELRQDLRSQRSGRQD